MVVSIERILWFVNRGIEIVIVAAIALMIIRMITDAMDLNPFAWTSRTIRRLTDGFVMPVRGGLRQFGVDVKFAPLIVILMVIVLGYFTTQLAGTIGSTVVGVWNSVIRGAMIAAIGYIIYGFLSCHSRLAEPRRVPCLCPRRS